MEKSIFKIGKTLLISLFLLMSLSVCSQNVGINTSGTNPDANAILDLNTGNSGNLGFLVPNVTLGTTLTAFWTGSVPAGPMANLPTAGDAGLMVYNSVATNQPIGYYYWNGATWVSFSGGAGTVTAADDGTSLNGTTVILGNAVSTIGGQLTQNTEIPLNNKYISFSAAGTSTTPGQIGVDLTAGTAPASSLDVNGSIGTNVSSILTSNTTLGSTNATVLVNPSGGAFTVTLPAPGATNTRRLYQIVYDASASTSNLVTITSPTANTIILSGTLGVTSFTINGGCVTLQSDGTYWHVVSGNVFDIPFASGGTPWYDANTTYYTSSINAFLYGWIFEEENAYTGANTPDIAKNTGNMAENTGTLASPTFTGYQTYWGTNFGVEPAMSYTQYIATTSSMLVSVNLYIEYSESGGNFDFEIWKYPSTSYTGVASTATLSGGVEVAGSTTLGITTGADVYHYILPGIAGVTVSPGDIFVIWVKETVGGAVIGYNGFWSGSMQFQSFQ